VLPVAGAALIGMEMLRASERDNGAGAAAAAAVRAALEAPAGLDDGISAEGARA
jgi:hypothetical protein